ncbi:metalloregulator ArsR/SmtB family transcription factor [Pedobacter sp. L105]|uniref:helix-turn-helix transcriptional regulator n=1 Tax=Pedobacter sp. L105 TaxID=1641871 RepID=UPI00131A96EB|nr:helix-turn-helix transcriptional regulator [Pedobacter sp. L105]
MEHKLPFRERAVELLKTSGPQSLSALAREFQVTVEGARFQMLRLEKEGVVTSNKTVTGRGRPQQLWSLTNAGQSRFPDTHAALTVKLMEIMKETLGEVAVSKVITANGEKGTSKYLEQLVGIDDLEQRIGTFVAIRTREGYMAQFIKDEEGFIFIENHCPIGAAAHANPGICIAEFKTLQTVIGEHVSIKRIEYIVDGGRRCAYRIYSLKKSL